MKSLNRLLRRVCGWAIRRRTALTFLIVFAAIFLRYLTFGAEYCWQHDDYIQYISFPLSGNYIGLLIEQGLLVSRPLAAVTDLLVWARFSQNMIISVMLVSALYAGSALLWQSVLGRRYGTGICFIVLYTLLPLNFEGSYWLSASTRIICGLFFTSLAVWLLVRFVEDTRPVCGILYFPALLLSYAYYEQTLVLSVAASLLLMLGYLFERRPRALLALSTFAAAGVYLWFTSLFAGDGGAIAARMELAIPNNPYYFKTYFFCNLSYLFSGLILNTFK